ncbi:hypothetical protein DXA95_11170 [Odoribacter sp. OF09-27XD]|nr:hypothetical protein DXA95_11170 [Odoribacter sp. OF09-27XD]
MIYKNEETDKVNLFESQIIDITFCPKGNSITFLVDWTENETPITIKCLYCSNYTFNVKSINSFLCTGFLITGFSYEKQEDHYTVQFNFDLSQEGFIKFDCTEFSLDVPSLPLQAGGNDNLL